MPDELDTIPAEDALSQPSEEGEGSTPASVERRRRAAPRRGDAIARYLVIEEVGRGAMGIVYAAYDPKLERKVAVKLLVDLDAGEQSLREAQALARLNHPNVVHVYDAGEHEGRVFTAMEFVVGQSLGRWCREGRPSSSAILEVFHRAALGLAAAHDAGLVHRDFKPDNVMIAEDGRVLVMDFGLAVAPRGEAPQRSRGGGMMGPGTPAYMSPEQFAGGPVDPRSDQFAFFVALHEALSGERPFAGDSLASLAMAVTSGELTQPKALRRAPAWLRRLVMQGLSREPEARHASMHEVATKLRAGLDRRGRLAWWGALGTVGLAVAGAWWVGTSTEDPEQAQCREEARALSTQWAQRQPQVKAAFARVLPADEVELWRQTDANIQGFVDTWTTRHDEACSARFVGRTLPEADFDRRVRCLGDQRVYATSLLETVGDDEADALRDIAAITAALPDPERCEQAGRLHGDFDRGSQDQVVEARRALMRGKGRSDAGDRVKAREILEGTLAGLEGVDAPATRAELLLQLGELEYEEGQLDAGRTALVASLREAARSGDAALLASHWLYYVDQVAGHHKEYERAEALLEAAEVAVAAVPDEPGLRCELESERGVLALQRGRTREASEAFARAVALGEEHHLSPMAMATHRGRLGGALAQLGELAEARVQLEQAAELNARLHGRRHRQVISSYMNLGLLCRQEGDRECERRYLEDAVALSDPAQPVYARAIVYLGQLEYDQGHLDRALELAERALALSEASLGPRHPDLTTAHLLLSNVFERRGDGAKALQHARTLLEIAEASTPEGHPKRAMALANLGEALEHTDDLAGALAAHQRALELRRSGLDPTDIRIGYSLAMTAEVLRKLERRAEAAALAQEAIGRLDASPGDEQWRADARFTLAQVTDEPAEARRLAEEALALVATGEGFEDRRERIRDWLDAHG